MEFGTFDLVTIEKDIRVDTPTLFAFEAARIAGAEHRANDSNAPANTTTVIIASPGRRPLDYISYLIVIRPTAAKLKLDMPALSRSATWTWLFDNKDIIHRHDSP